MSSETAVAHVAAVTAHPDLQGLPGSNVLQQLVNGAEAWALVIALLGAFVGAGLWAVASHTHNHHYAGAGTDGGADLSGGGAGHRGRPRPRQLLRASRRDGQMTGPARAVALIAVLAALVLSATPATASARRSAGTVCSLTGWVSGLAAKLCTVATHAGASPQRGQEAGRWARRRRDRRALRQRSTRRVARAAGVAAIATGVIGGAQEALKLTVKAVGGSTNPDLGAVWFSASYWRMAAVAALLTVPFLFAAAIQAILRSDVTLLLRSAFGYLPLGMLAVGVAAPLTGLLLAASDEMSTIVSSASGHAGASFLDHVGGSWGVVSALSGTVFVSFFIALFTIAAAITLWLELLIRQAAVYVIVLMLPLFFAAMVWPARRIWAVRAVELLVALILSKFAIVAVLGLGGAALGHTLLPGIGSFLAGTTLVLLAAFSPWAMLRLLPLHELAGAAVGGLRPHTAQPPQATDSRHRGPPTQPKVP